MKNLFFFITLLSTFYCLGQSPGLIGRPSSPGDNNGLISANNRHGAQQAKGMIPYEELLLEYETIEGSPFLHGKEIVVDFIFHTDSIIENIPIKYDLYNHEIIVNTGDGNNIILDQNYYKGFVYDNEGEEELYLRMQPNDPVFYHILFSSDDFYFCKKTKIRLVKEERHVPGQDIKPEKFMQKFEYFVKQLNFLLEVQLKNDKAIPYFPLAYRQQVSSLKKELRMKKLRKEEDYVRLIGAFDN